eukprot:scaffold40464_cov63-Phaeocystis_antarctica.AAC.5
MHLQRTPTPTWLVQSARDVSVAHREPSTAVGVPCARSAVTRRSCQSFTLLPRWKSHAALAHLSPARALHVDYSARSRCPRTASVRTAFYLAAARDYRTTPTSRTTATFDYHGSAHMARV